MKGKTRVLKITLIGHLHDVEVLASIFGNALTVVSDSGNHSAWKNQGVRRHFEVQVVVPGSRGKRK